MLFKNILKPFIDEVGPLAEEAGLRLKTSVDIPMGSGSQVLAEGKVYGFDANADFRRIVHQGKYSRTVEYWTQVSVTAASPFRLEGTLVDFGLHEKFFLWLQGVKPLESPADGQAYRGKPVEAAQRYLNDHASYLKEGLIRDAGHLLRLSVSGTEVSLKLNSLPGENKLPSWLKACSELAGRLNP